VKNEEVNIPKGKYSKIIIAKGAAGAKISLKNVTAKKLQVNGRKNADMTTINLKGSTSVGTLVAGTSMNVSAASQKSSVDTISVKSASTVEVNTPTTNINVTNAAKGATVHINQEVASVTCSAANAEINVNAEAEKISVNGKNGTINVKDNVTVKKVVSKAEGTLVKGEGSIKAVTVKADNAKIDVMTSNVVTSAGVEGTVVNGIDVPADSKAKITIEKNGNETVTGYLIVDNTTQEKTEGTKTVTVTEKGTETVAITEKVTDVTGEVVKRIESVTDESGQTTTMTTDKDGNTSTEVTDKNGNDVTDTPSIDTPSIDTPSTDTPSTDTPSTETPSTDNPSTDGATSGGSTSGGGATSGESTSGGGTTSGGNTSGGGTTSGESTSGGGTTSGGSTSGGGTTSGGSTSGGGTTSGGSMSGGGTTSGGSTTSSGTIENGKDDSGSSDSNSGMANTEQKKNGKLYRKIGKSFETGVDVNSYEELTKAIEEKANVIFICKEIEIPTGSELEVPKDTYLTLLAPLKVSGTVKVNSLYQFRYWSKDVVEIGNTGKLVLEGNEYTCESGMTVEPADTETESIAAIKTEAGDTLNITVSETGKSFELNSYLSGNGYSIECPKVQISRESGIETYRKDGNGFEACVDVSSYEELAKAISDNVKKIYICKKIETPADYVLEVPDDTYITLLAPLKVSGTVKVNSLFRFRYWSQDVVEIGSTGKLVLDGNEYTCETGMTVEPADTETENIAAIRTEDESVLNIEVAEGKTLDLDKYFTDNHYTLKCRKVQINDGGNTTLYRVTDTLFEIGTDVSNYEELDQAIKDGAENIFVGKEITIPAGSELEISENTYITLFAMLHVNGTIKVNRLFQFRYRSQDVVQIGNTGKLVLDGNEYTCETGMTIEPEDTDEKSIAAIKTEAGGTLNITVLETGKSFGLNSYLSENGYSIECPKVQISRESGIETYRKDGNGFEACVDVSSYEELAKAINDYAKKIYICKEIEIPEGSELEVPDDTYITLLAPLKVSGTVKVNSLFRFRYWSQDVVEIESTGKLVLDGNEYTCEKGMTVEPADTDTQNIAAIRTKNGGTLNIAIPETGALFDLNKYFLENNYCMKCPKVQEIKGSDIATYRWRNDRYFELCIDVYTYDEFIQALKEETEFIYLCSEIEIPEGTGLDVPDGTYLTLLEPFKVNGTVKVNSLFRFRYWSQDVVEIGSTGKLVLDGNEYTCDTGMTVEPADTETENIAAIRTEDESVLNIKVAEGKTLDLDKYFTDNHYTLKCQKVRINDGGNTTLYRVTDTLFEIGKDVSSYEELEQAIKDGAENIFVDKEIEIPAGSELEIPGNTYITLWAPLHVNGTIKVSSLFQFRYRSQDVVDIGNTGKLILDGNKYTCETGMTVEPADMDGKSIAAVKTKADATLEITVSDALFDLNTYLSKNNYFIECPKVIISDTETTIE
jgi:hypothetical protein